MTYINYRLSISLRCDPITRQIISMHESLALLCVTLLCASARVDTTTMPLRRFTPKRGDVTCAVVRCGIQLPVTCYLIGLGTSINFFIEVFGRAFNIIGQKGMFLALI